MMTYTNTQQKVDDYVLEQVRQQVKSDIVTFSTGVKVRLKSVAPKLIQEIMSRIKDPVVPITMNEEKGRQEENPLDPQYLALKDETELKRVDAAIDYFLIEGVELLDAIPELDEWLPSLRFLEKLGHIALPDIDWESELEVGYIYKKYKALGNDDYNMVMSYYGLTQEDVAEASNTFRS